MSLTGMILLCHGSRGDRAVSDLPARMESIAAGATALLPGKIAVAWAALQFNRPTLEEAAASLVAEGVKSIIIMPYFLFSGRHIEEDIPEIIGLLRERYPDVGFTMTGALGEGERFILQIIDRIREAVPGLWLAPPDIPVPPGEIEIRSMDIVKRLLPPGPALSGGERVIVKRIVHAGGDPQIIGLLRFSPEAVTAGTDALGSGSPIFTDVRMVAAGINSHLAAACGCTVLCALDETGNGNNSNGRMTRAAAAVRYLGQRLNGAVVAIGNAPTALIELLELIDKENVTPALVIGMPVGFVRAAESKEALMEREVPFITVAGTRGGSAMAAATVNALLRLALGGEPRT